MFREIDFSVVVCTYNRCASLDKCISAVTKLAYNNYEIIIIDDHSNDGTQNLLENYRLNGLNIRIHRNERNMGISYSRNKAAMIASNKIIAFIDDDCIADKNWLQELGRPFENPRVAIVGGLIKDPPPINIAMMAARGHYKRFNEEGQCNSLPGGAANLAIRKDFYLNNPVQNLALEDWELCQKAIDSGHLIYNCPKAFVVHEHYHNLKTLFKQRYRYGIGQTWFRKKYKAFPVNLKTLFLIIILLSIPFILISNFFLISILIISVIFTALIFYKDLKKGEKPTSQAIISLPVFVMIAMAECYGRIVGLYKKPIQINFGNDFITIVNHDIAK